jgi:LytS/YehU family sensor histidine kinase
MLILLSSYFLHRPIFPLVDAAFNYSPKIPDQNIWWTSISSGLLSAPKIISAAAAIKLTKRWWLKQKEKERLEQEKLITDLQLLKAQIHPELLFSSLNYISQLTEKKDNKKAAVLLLKLADILSYMLYECNSRLVDLEKEIKVIRDYLVLVKTRMGNKLEIDVAVKGEIGSKMIAPLVLFSFVENSFSLFCHKKIERNWMNLEFQVDFNEISMKLIHGKNAEPTLSSIQGSTIERAIKWLEFYYPDRYELKTTVEPEMMMTFLKIELDDTVGENENTIYDPEQIDYAAV